MPEFDLSGFLTDDTWRVGGIADAHGVAHSYAIASPNGADGLLLRSLYRQLNAGGTLTAETSDLMAQYCRDSAGKPIDFDVKLLGDAHAAMIADGISATRIGKVAQAAFMRFGVSEEALRLVVDAEGKAAAATATRQRAAAKRPSSPSKGGSSSSRASGAKSTRTSGARTRGSGASAPRKRTA